MLATTGCTASADIDGGQDDQVVSAGFETGLRAIEDSAGSEVAAAHERLRQAVEDEPAGVPDGLNEVRAAVRRLREAYQQLEPPEPYRSANEDVARALDRHERALTAALEAFGSDHRSAALTELADAAVDATAARALLAERLARDG